MILWCIFNDSSYHFYITHNIIICYLKYYESRAWSYKYHIVYCIYCFNNTIQSFSITHIYNKFRIKITLYFVCFRTAPPECEPTLLPCRQYHWNKTYCYPPHYRCDVTVDCVDGSDEADCSEYIIILIIIKNMIFTILSA